ncbi:MAG: DUF4159 domain-containing protein [Melioribacteraceae bacterium]|nr:DUF4159 domain-containing protein [Melioribacteraceae bacterium]MCF8263207.1 DUF4159 domain-containing protein [Melioribacteraceae bacterium]MCF8412718.1 DUF4159 domain-containing protein [Melioribacteraceae bacterium]
MILKLTLFLFFSSTFIFSQIESGFKIGRLKYDGGGDWYNDRSADVNLLKFLSENTNLETDPNYYFVEVGSSDIFSFPFLFLTGHGNIVLSENDASNLRKYLENGGFIYVDDDYSLDKAFRREIKKVFPENDLIELPFDHEIYHSVYDFNNGPPKTHEHDNKPPKGYGIFVDGKLVLYYTYESNPSDGWADSEVHKNPPEKREEALKFGTNIIVWVLTN